MVSVTQKTSFREGSEIQLRKIMKGLGENIMKSLRKSKLFFLKKASLRVLQFYGRLLYLMYLLLLAKIK